MINRTFIYHLEVLSESGIATLRTATHGATMDVPVRAMVVDYGKFASRPDHKAHRTLSVPINRFSHIAYCLQYIIAYVILATRPTILSSH